MFCFFVLFWSNTQIKFTVMGFVFEKKLPRSRSTCVGILKGSTIEELPSRLNLKLSKANYFRKRMSVPMISLGLRGVLTNAFLLFKNKPLHLNKASLSVLPQRMNPMSLIYRKSLMRQFTSLTLTSCPRPPEQSFPLSRHEQSSCRL